MFNILSSLVHKGMKFESLDIFKGRVLTSNIHETINCGINFKINHFFSRPIITRYSQLESFHRKMIIRHPELAADIPFPRKRFFGNFNSSMLMKRTQQFRSYFLHILNGKNFKYRNSHIFRDFLISDQDWCLQ